MPLSGNFTGRAVHTVAHFGQFGQFGIGNLEVRATNTATGLLAATTLTYANMDTPSNIGNFSIALDPGNYSLTFYRNGTQIGQETVTIGENPVNRNFLLNYARGPHQIYVDGARVDYDLAFIPDPLTPNTYAISLRVLGEAAGFDVNWSSVTRQATLESDRWQLRRIINENSNRVDFVYVDTGLFHGYRIMDGTAPFLYNDMIFIRYNNVGFVSTLQAESGLHQGAYGGHFRLTFTDLGEGPGIFPFSDDLPLFP